MEKTELVKFDAAISAIAKARSVDEVKDIRDKAEAVRKYAKQAGISLEGQNMLAEIKLRAERKAGALLAEMEGKGLHAGYRKSSCMMEVETLQPYPRARAERARMPPVQRRGENFFRAGLRACSS